MKRVVDFLFSDPAVILYSVLLGGLRVGLFFAGVSEGFWYQVFKDIGHLFFGGLSVAAWTGGRPLMWGLFWGLGLTEVATSALAAFTR